MTKRIFTVSILMGLAVLTWTHSSSSVSKEEVLRKLQRMYQETVDFSADFVQVTLLKATNRQVQYSGRVHFKKPGKMRWDYNVPKGQTIVVDGKFLWFYQPEEKQVIKSPLQEQRRKQS